MFKWYTMCSESFKLSMTRPHSYININKRCCWMLAKQLLVNDVSNTEKRYINSVWVNECFREMYVYINRLTSIYGSKSKTRPLPYGPHGKTTQSCSHFRIWTEVHIICGVQSARREDSGLRYKEHNSESRVISDVLSFVF